MPKVFFCRKVRFTAAHHYRVRAWSPAKNRQVFGPSAEPHSHHWEITVWLEGPVDPETGMIADLAEVDGILEREIVEPFDQKDFHGADPEFFARHQPTNEVLAGYFAEKLAPLLARVRLTRLRVAECDEIFAEWQS